MNKSPGMKAQYTALGRGYSGVQCSNRVLHANAQEIAMKRWNGWGDDAIELVLPAEALPLWQLAQLVAAVKRL